MTFSNEREKLHFSKMESYDKDIDFTYDSDSVWLLKHLTENVTGNNRDDVVQKCKPYIEEFHNRYYKMISNDEIWMNKVTQTGLLNRSHFESLDRYQGDEFRAINDAVRSGQDHPGVSNINHIFSVSPRVKEPVIVYRSATYIGNKVDTTTWESTSEKIGEGDIPISEEDYITIDNPPKKGDVFRMSSYTSTTASPITTTQNFSGDTYAIILPVGMPHINIQVMARCNPFDFFSSRDICTENGLSIPERIKLSDDKLVETLRNRELDESGRVQYKERRSLERKSLESMRLNKVSSSWSEPTREFVNWVDSKMYYEYEILLPQNTTLKVVDIVSFKEGTPMNCGKKTGLGIDKNRLFVCVVVPTSKPVSIPVNYTLYRTFNDYLIFNHNFNSVLKSVTGTVDKYMKSEVLTSIPKKSGDFDYNGLSLTIDRSGNVLYDYQAGKCANQLNEVVPLFVKTYALLDGNNVAKEHDLEPLIKITCNGNNTLGRLLQKVPGKSLSEMPIDRDIEMSMAYLVSCLYLLYNRFEYRNLKPEHIVMYTIPDDKYLQVKIEEMSIYLRYLPIITDFSGCYFNCALADVVKVKANRYDLIFGGTSSYEIMSNVCDRCQDCGQKSGYPKVGSWDTQEREFTDLKYTGSVPGFIVDRIPFPIGNNIEDSFKAVAVIYYDQSERQEKLYGTLTLPYKLALETFENKASFELARPSVSAQNTRDTSIEWYRYQLTLVKTDPNSIPTLYTQLAEVVRKDPTFAKKLLSTSSQHRRAISAGLSTLVATMLTRLYRDLNRVHRRLEKYNLRLVLSPVPTFYNEETVGDMVALVLSRLAKR